MISRRQLLQLGGLTALGVGFPRGVRATSDPIRRLILVSHCHGWPYETWKMRPEGRSVAEPWSIDLGPLAETELSRPLAPLYAHRRRVIALDGLSLATAELDMWLHSVHDKYTQHMFLNSLQHMFCSRSEAMSYVSHNLKEL